MKTLLTIEIGRAARNSDVPISPFNRNSIIVTVSADLINLVFIGLMPIGCVQVSSHLADKLG